MEKRFYRFVDSHREYGSPIELKEYLLVRETKCGYWIIPDYIGDHYGDEFKENHKRWISKDSRKRYAYPTKQEALTSFKKKKRTANNNNN